MTTVSYICIGGEFVPLQTFYNLVSEKKDRIIEAATNEFADNTFEESKISNIISDAGISRGSFYQYFSDKLDLYNYLVNDIIKPKKMKYINEVLNPNEGFMSLMRSMYRAGIKFGKDNPQYVKIARNFLLSDKEFQSKLVGDSYKEVQDMFVMLITKDIENGRIRKDIDAVKLGKIFLDINNTLFTQKYADTSVCEEELLAEFDMLFEIMENGLIKKED